MSKPSFVQLVQDHDTLERSNLEWQATLVFSISATAFLQGDLPDLSTTRFVKQNLFHLINHHAAGLSKWYFSPTDYPFDGTFGESKTWVTLVSDLVRAAPNEGFSLVSNGRKTQTTICLYCSRFRKARSFSLPKEPSSYRGSFIRSDRRTGNRGTDGKSLPRRRDTQLSISSDGCCPVKLCFGSDYRGYFLSGQRSFGTHKHHPRLAVGTGPSTKHSELTLVDDMYLKSMRLGGLSLQGAASAFHLTHGRSITCSQVYMRTQNVTYRTNPGFTDEPASLKTTSADRLLTELRENKHDHVVLIHRAGDHSMQMSQKIEGNAEKDMCLNNFWTNDETTGMNSFVQNQR